MKDSPGSSPDQLLFYFLLFFSFRKNFSLFFQIEPFSLNFPPHTESIRELVSHTRIGERTEKRERVRDFLGKLCGKRKRKSGCEKESERVRKVRGIKSGKGDEGKGKKGKEIEGN